MKLEDIVKLGMLLGDLLETLHMLIRAGVLDLHSELGCYFITNKHHDYFCTITKDLYEYLKGMKQ